MTNTQTTADLRVTGFSFFAGTEVTAEATSAAGREFLAFHFGPGAIAVTLPKSRWAAFHAAATERGLEVA